MRLRQRMFSTIIAMNIIATSKSKVLPFTPEYDEKKIFGPLFVFARICAIKTPDLFKENSGSCWYLLYSVTVLAFTVTLCAWSVINKCLERNSYSSFCVFLFEIISDSV